MNVFNVYVVKAFVRLGYAYARLVLKHRRTQDLETFTYAAYHAFLQREPEPQELQEKLLFLQQKKKPRQALLHLIFTSDEYKRLKDPTLRRQYVIWGYRLFLDREPENEHVIKEKLHAWNKISDLRIDFMSSDEFRQNNPDLAFVRERNIVIKELDNHLRLCIDLCDHVIGMDIIRGTFEKNEIHFVQNTVKPGQVVLDIGANVGFFAIHMASLVGASGKVVAFEPVDQNAELLELSIQENGFTDIVTLERCAVGQTSGSTQLVFSTNTLNSGGAYITNEHVLLPAHHEVKPINVVALNDYSLIRPVHFIKIDVEGAEPMVLQGATAILKEDRPVILSELHPDQLMNVSGYTPAQFIADMRSYGYTCHVLEKSVPREEITDVTDSRVLSVVFLPTGKHHLDSHK